MRLISERLLAASSVLTRQDVVYHQYIVDLNEPIRVMADIDQVIDAHNGWRIE